MLSLPWIFKLNNYISYFSRPPPAKFYVISNFTFNFRRFLMDKYFNSYLEMISLRGLTDHTVSATALTSVLTLIIFPTFSASPRKMFPGRNCAIISNGFNMNVNFRIVLSTVLFLSCVSSPCMSFINLGMIHSSLFANLRPIFPMFLLLMK